jgi:hypothetical protein
MKCLNEFTMWRMKQPNGHVHPSEVWSAAWDACEKAQKLYIAQLVDHIERLQIDLHVYRNEKK